MNKPNLIPFFVEADSKEELMKKMLQINMKANAFHKYFDIQKDGKKWVGWYYANVSFEVRNANSK